MATASWIWRVTNQCASASNCANGSVSILLGDGSGNFSLNSTIAAGENAKSVAVGDFNGDGKLDLAVANNLSNTVSILLGNGDGTFTPTLSSPSTGAQPDSIAVGDFNDDGKLDLAVSYFAGGTVGVFAGNGNGTFTPYVAPMSPLSSPSLIAVGDFNGDGRLDIAAVNYYSTSLLIWLQASSVVQVTLSPPTLTFSDQPVNNISGALQVILTNSGGATVTISNIAINGANASDFSLSGNGTTCTTTSPVPANGGTCAISVTFTPSAGGARTATLTVTDTASNSPQSASLTGTGSASTGGSPTGSLSPQTLSFNAPQTVSTTSDPLPITLTNTSTGTLSLTNIATTGDFAVASTGTTCSISATLAAGEACTINVTFSPTAVGTRTGSLTFMDNNNGTAGSPQTASLTGTGTPMPVILIPGIMGSTLMNDHGAGPEVWPLPDTSLYADLSLLPPDSPSPTIVATDVIRGVSLGPVNQLINFEFYGTFITFLTSNGFPAYELNGNPNLLTTSECATTEILASQSYSFFRMTGARAMLRVLRSWQTTWAASRSSTREQRLTLWLTVWADSSPDGSSSNTILTITQTP